MLVVFRCSGVTSPCRVNEHSRDGAAWCKKSWRKRWSTCLPPFWPRWALQCHGAGWKVQTQCILSSQALGLPPEVLFCIFVLESMGYFYLMRPLDSMSFLSGIGRSCDHRNFNWGFVVFCWLLLPCVQQFGIPMVLLPSSQSSSQESV